MTNLETGLQARRAIVPSAEGDIDILRSILRGESGTVTQRAMLIRVLKQVKPKRTLTVRLINALEPTVRLAAPTHSYLNEDRNPSTEEPKNQAA